MSNIKKLNHFQTDHLINFCDSITDCHHSSPVYKESGKLVIRNYNIKKGRLILSDVSYTDEETFNTRIARTKPEPGDLIITREAPMGEVCIIPKGLDCCLGQRMVLIKPNGNKVDNKYLLYSLLSQYVQIQINKSEGIGSIVSNLRIPLLKELNIPNRKLNEQKLIGKVLSDLDAKIELNNKINDNLEQMAKTLYDYWFVQFDFPDANGKPYKTSGGKMVWNEELKRKIPEGWEAGTLDSIGDIIGGSTPSKAIDNNFCYREGTPWITPKDLSNNKGKKYITRGEYDVTNKGLKDASLKIMPLGTVLLSSRAPIGYLAIARNEVTTNQGFKSFVPKDRFSSEYIYYTIQNHIPEIEANSSGSTFKEVSSSTLRTIKTILPTNEILLIFNNKIKPIFKKQDCLELENQELASLRDWLLPMLMNGQVSVGDVEEELGMVAEERERYGK